MKEDLISLGFTPMKYSFFEKDFGEFYIEANPEGYFFIYTKQSGDRESAPYDYKGKEKLQNLINAHIEYFK